MRKNKRGFTVIELIAVICVLAVLVSLALPRYLGYTKDARFTRLIHDTRLLEEAATRYYLANGAWPRASDTYYTKDQVLAFSPTIYDSSGRKVDLDPSGQYYDIDFKALSKYITIFSDPKNFILFIPESSDAAVYILDPASNMRLTVSGSLEPQPIRQPVSGEIAIRTPEELAKIGVDPNYPLSGKYIQMANLDLSGYSNWNPIGNSKPFTGTFDGNGFVIKNLMINRPTNDRQGLFGYTDSTTQLTNIGLENVDVTGQYYTGGLVGLNWYGTITNSYSMGSVQGKSQIGGMVGQNYCGTISDSYSTCSVLGKSSVGGLVGDNTALGSNTTSIIKNSYATGNVTGSSSSIGGLVGENNAGTIADNYSTGNVKGYSFVGGLVGYNTGKGNITNSYSMGSVQGTSGNKIGGLVGDNYDATVTNSYWDTETSGITTSSGGVGKTTAQMKQQATFTGWDFTTVWAIDEDKSYPYLRSNEQIPHPGTSQ